MSCTKTKFNSYVLAVRTFEKRSTDINFYGMILYSLLFLFFIDSLNPSAGVVLATWAPEMGMGLQ